MSKYNIAVFIAAIVACVLQMLAKHEMQGEGKEGEEGEGRGGKEKE